MPHVMIYPHVIPVTHPHVTHPHVAPVTSTCDSPLSFAFAMIVGTTFAPSSSYKEEPILRSNITCG